MKLLFICTENKLRSATAETVFSAYEGIEAIGAGTNKDAPTPVTGDLIEWADVIFVMEQTHKAKISRDYKSLLSDKKLVCLDIKDRYSYMQDELVALLKARVSKTIGLP